MGGDGKKEEKGQEVITAVYKLHLHCPGCAADIEKPLSKTEGVEKVTTDAKGNKISIKGKIDAKKILKVIEKIAKRKVELVEEKKVEEKKEDKKKEDKKDEVKITVLKVDMHCEQCANDLKKMMLEIKGVVNVKTDWRKQTCTVEGTIKPEELVKYARKKLNKHAEIVPPKEEKKEEKKDKNKEEEKKKETESSKEAAKVLVPYVIYCPHVPHDSLAIFSDENANSCGIM